MDRSGRGPVIDTLANGAVRVANRQIDAWAGTEPWVLVEELRLGAVDDDGPELFATILDFALDAAGSIYVLDAGSREIRVFDSGGHFLRSQGGPGEGPGEFGGVGGLTWGPAGELWVVDYSLHVYTAFAPDGTFLRSMPRAVRGFIYPWPGWFDSGGFLVDWTYSRERVAVEDFPAREIRKLVRVSSDGEPLDTPLVLSHVVPLVASGERWIPFRPATGMRPGPSGSLLWYRTDEYSIARVTLSGDTTLVFSLDSSPAPVTDAERDSVLAIGGSEGPRYSSLDIPRAKPIIRRMTVGDDGYIYVLPETVGRGAGSVVDIFTDAGVYLGAMEAPGISVGRGAPPPVVRGGYLHAVVRDELDVENLIRFRIERPDGS
ncbi:MAG: hypothetical protein OXJ54_02940 [Gemmatimonadetes bacterium]|nr:hypothetical protein [Candidatus Palauibacter rhopaloidicola]